MANLKKAFDTKGRDLVLGFEKSVVLAMIDDSWKEHLRELDDLKQAVQNASLEQKDPLVIYKLESFNLFKEMIISSNKEVISFLMKAGLPSDNEPQQPQARFTQQAPVQKEKLEKPSQRTCCGRTKCTAKTETTANSCRSEDWSQRPLSLWQREK